MDQDTHIPTAIRRTLQKAKLNDWYVGENDMLYGYVFGHPKIKDGELVQTSRVVSFDPEAGIAVTKNTEYELGVPMRRELINA